VELLICGVRGSTHASGRDFVRYGGNTSCIAVARAGERPHLVLDAGTGLRTLTRMMEGDPFDGTILIGHLHWDHTHGMPFFRSGDREGARVRVLIPEQGDDPSELMARCMGPPHFPVRLEELQGSWSIGSLTEGEHEIEGFRVLAREIPHKNARTFGFRVTDGTSTIAYLSDHSPVALGPGEDGHGEYHEAARALATGADLLIHDAQYTSAEFGARKSFGHSSIDYAVGLAETCGVKKLMLFHHDSERTDDEIDEIVAKLQNAAVEVVAATEGTKISV
jgi:phosphoribosyl 1,2-cyclic phosphodiesterase